MHWNPLQRVDETWNYLNQYSLPQLHHFFYGHHISKVRFSNICVCVTVSCVCMCMLCVHMHMLCVHIIRGGSDDPAGLALAGQVTVCHCLSCDCKYGYIFCNTK